MTIKNLTRRLILKFLSLGSILGLVRSSGTANSSTSKHSQPNPSSGKAVSRWSNTHDRVWLGEQFWANPMENWQVVNGAAECQSKGGNRNIHLVTHQFTNPAGSTEMSVRIGRVEKGNQDSGAGFKLGIKSDLNEFRSNCFATKGTIAGLVGRELTLGRKTKTLQAAPKILSSTSQVNQLMEMERAMSS